MTRSSLAGLSRRAVEAVVQVLLGVILGGGAVAMLWVVASSAPSPAEAERLKAAVQSATEDHLEAKRDLARAEKDLRVAVERRGRAEEEHDEFNANLDELKRQGVLLVRDYKRMEEEQEELQSAVRSLRQERETAQAAADASRAEMESLQEQVHALAAEAESHREAIAALAGKSDIERQQEVARLNQELDEAGRALDSARAEAQEAALLRVQLAEAKSAQQTLNSELDHHRAFARDVVLLTYGVYAQRPVLSEFLADYEHQQVTVLRHMSGEKRERFEEQLEYSLAVLGVEPLTRLTRTGPYGGIWSQAMEDAGIDLSRYRGLSTVEQLKRMRVDLTIDLPQWDGSAKR